MKRHDRKNETSKNVEKDDQENAEEKAVVWV